MDLDACCWLVAIAVDPSALHGLAAIVGLQQNVGPVPNLWLV